MFNLKVLPTRQEVQVTESCRLTGQGGGGLVRGKSGKGGSPRQAETPNLCTKKSNQVLGYRLKHSCLGEILGESVKNNQHLEG